MEEMGFGSAEVGASWDRKDRVGRTLLLKVKKGRQSIVGAIKMEGTLPEPAAVLASSLSIRSGDPCCKPPLIARPISCAADYSTKVF